MPRKSDPEAVPETLTAEQWAAQEPCAYCHQRPGYNPATGQWVRSWDAATKTFVDGHRLDCQRPKGRA